MFRCINNITGYCSGTPKGILHQEGVMDYKPNSCENDYNKCEHYKTFSQISQTSKDSQSELFN